MDKQKEEALKIAHEFIIYLDSECADENNEDNPFDACWQSIYDMCKLIHYEIIDGYNEDEYNEAYNWLKKYQELTDDYKDLEIDF